jgi:hypothetical protein
VVFINVPLFNVNCFNPYTADEKIIVSGSESNGLGVMLGDSWHSVTFQHNIQHCPCRIGLAEACGIVPQGAEQGRVAQETADPTCSLLKSVKFSHRYLHWKFREPFAVQKQNSLLSPGTATFSWQS